MKAEDILGLLVPVTFILFLVTERLFPRRRYPPIKFWNLIGFACLIMTGVISTLLDTVAGCAVQVRAHFVSVNHPGVLGG